MAMENGYDTWYLLIYPIHCNGIWHKVILKWGAQVSSHRQSCPVTDITLASIFHQNSHFCAKGVGVVTRLESPWPGIPHLFVLSEDS